ncbi:hypothetical protein PoB_004703200 [Plakobranchus ocellatus]|uniref:Uncharacterized protein n=1 Tax=Plakobranchus ocellatus TaxID=259542 RepID=A0AAV4BMG4_9GAST|nr:hypothetical protein PoB_004703200 [Plakobranchus ocellatus]
MIPNYVGCPFSVARELAPIMCSDLSVVRSSLARTCELDKSLEVGGQHHLNTSTSSLNVSVDHATYQPNLNLRTNQLCKQASKQSFHSTCILDKHETNQLIRQPNDERKSNSQQTSHIEKSSLSEKSIPKPA